MKLCPFCGSRLVRRFDHNPRRLVSMDGEYRVREHVQRCSNKDCKGFKTSFRSEELQRLVIPRKIFSLDVLITIGTSRYEEHKTYDENIDSLAKKGIKISKGKVFNLFQTFESLIKGWHDERVAGIRAKLKEYVLSVGGTYSYKDKTLTPSKMYYLAFPCKRSISFKPCEVTAPTKRTFRKAIFTSGKRAYRRMLAKEDVLLSTSVKSV